MGRGEGKRWARFGAWGEGLRCSSLWHSLPWVLSCAPVTVSFYLVILLLPFPQRKKILDFTLFCVHQDVVGTFDGINWEMAKKIEKYKASVEARTPTTWPIAYNQGPITCHSRFRMFNGFHGTLVKPSSTKGCSSCSYYSTISLKYIAPIYYSNILLLNYITQTYYSNILLK